MCDNLTFARPSVTLILVMQKHIPAIYENGVFKPLTDLQLPEHQAVHLIIEEDECSESMETLAIQGGVRFSEGR